MILLLDAFIALNVNVPIQ